MRLRKYSGWLYLFFIVELILAWFLCGLYQREAVLNGETPIFTNLILQTQKMAYSQILCVLVIFLLGYLLLYIFKDGFSMTERAILAYPCGMSLIFVCGAVLLSLRIPYNLITLGVFISLCLVVGKCLMIYFHGKQAASTTQWCEFAIILVAVLAISCFCVLSRTKLLSSDSQRYYQLMGTFIAASGKLPSFTSEFTGSVGPFQPIVSTLAPMLSFPQTFGLQKALSLNAGVFFAYIVWIAMPATMKNSRRFACLIISAVSAAVVWLQPVTALLTSWLLANIYAMAYLVFAVGLCYMLHSRADKGIDGLAALALFSVGLCFSRIEGMFFVLIVFICAIPLSFRRMQLLCGLLVFPFINILIYYGNLYLLKAPMSSTFLTYKRIFLALLGYCACILYTLFLRENNFLKIKKHAWAISLAGMAFITLIETVMVFSRYIWNISVIGRNISTFSVWGLGAVFLVVYAAVLIYDRFRLSYYDVFIMLYVMFNFALYGYRKVPLRVTLGDSGNRTFMQVFPLVCLALFMKLIILYSERNALRISENKTP